MNSSQQMLLADFMQITQTDLKTATHMMEASSWDLDKALSLFYETGGYVDHDSATPPPTSPTPTPAPVSSMTQHHVPSSLQGNQYLDDPIPSPLPQIAQRLIGSPLGHPSSSSGFSPNITGSAGIPFLPRNPQQEAEAINQQFVEFSNQMRQESSMQSNHFPHLYPQSTPNAASSEFVQQNAPNGEFDKLFAEPHKIKFKGTFEQAKDFAASEQKWVLVSIQQKEDFQSMRMNRDTWSNDILQDIISVYFVLWLTDVSTPEGTKYKTLYSVTQLPHIALIDPRTGEQKKFYQGFISPEKLLDEMQKFIDSRPVDQPGPTPTKETKSTHLDVSPKLVPASNTSISNSMFIDDEEADLMMALQASLEPASVSVLASGSAASSQQISSEEASTRQNMEEEEDVSKPQHLDIDPSPYLTDLEENSTRLQLRIPNTKPQVVRVKLDMPLAALYALFRQKLPEDQQQKKFKIIFLNIELKNTLNETLNDRNIAGSSLSLKFDEE